MFRYRSGHKNQNLGTGNFAAQAVLEAALGSAKPASMERNLYLMGTLGGTCPTPSTQAQMLLLLVLLSFKIFKTQ